SYYESSRRRNSKFQASEAGVGTPGSVIRVDSCPFVVKFYRDSIAKAPATVIARNVNFLRVRFRRLERPFDISEPRRRPEKRRTSHPNNSHDKSINHQPNECQTVR